MFSTNSLLRSSGRIGTGGPAARRPRRRPLRRGALALVAALGLGLSACGSGSNNGSTSGTTAPKKLTTVTVVVPAYTTTFLQLFVGEYDGYFKKYGLNVKIEKVPGVAMVPALLSGEAQFIGAVGQTFDPSKQKMKIVEASSLWAPFALVGAKDVTSIQQLKGKTIAGGGPVTGQPDQFIKVAMSEAGISSKTYSVATVSDTAGGRFDAVEAGKATAAPVDLNYLVAPPVEGWPVLAKGKVFHSMGSGLFTSTAELKSDPSVVKRMVEASAAATAAGYKSEKVAVAAWKKGLATEHLGYTTAQWDQIWKLEKPIFAGDGCPTSAAEQTFLSLIKTSITLPAVPAFSQVFYLKYLPKKCQ